jgi:WD40 repeat protein
LPTDRVRAAVSPDGKLLATIGPNGETALVFETDSLKLRSPALVPPRHARTGGKSKVRAFAFSPDGKSLTVANDDGAVSRHDVSNEKGDGAPIAVCRGVVSGSITSLAVDASGTVAVVGGEDKSLSAVPLSGMREPFLPIEVQADVPNQSYSGHWGAVSAVAFDASTRCVSVGGGDAVYVWDVDARAGKALAASKPRDHVSFAEPTSEDTADTYGSDSDDGSVPTLSDGSVSGDDLEEVPAGTSSDAFAHKPKLAATPSKISSRGILKKHEKSPPKSALKTDGKYGSAASTPVKGSEDAPAADKSKVRRSLADMPVEVLVPEDRPTEQKTAPERDPTVPKQKVSQPVLERAASNKKPVTIRPTRIIGLSTGASAAGNEATESAAAVAAATAAAPALYIPELGSVRSS